MSKIAIRIITDSTCDMSLADQERFNIEVLPLTVQFSGVSYADGVELTAEQFYEKLDHCSELPTTSQIRPQTFTDVFQKHLDAGDEVVGIFLSSEISGTYQSACIAKDAVDSDKIHVVDSRNATMGLSVLMVEAAKHRDAGHSAVEIAAHITGLTKKVRFLAVVNTLKYLHKGGRVSTASAVIGEVLGVKPIVSIINGKVEAIGKARGMQAALKSLLNTALDDLPDLQYCVVFAHSSAPQLLQNAKALLKGPLNVTEWITCSIGSVIGTYAGRGAVGIAYIAQQ